MVLAQGQGGRNSGITQKEWNKETDTVHHLMARSQICKFTEAGALDPTWRVERDEECSPKALSCSQHTPHLQPAAHQASVKERKNYCASVSR